MLMLLKIDNIIDDDDDDDPSWSNSSSRSDKLQLTNAKLIEANTTERLNFASNANAKSTTTHKQLMLIRFCSVLHIYLKFSVDNP